MPSFALISGLANRSLSLRPACRAALGVVVTAVAVTGGAFAQDRTTASPPEAVVFSDLVEVSEVVLDVLVLDGEGRTVSDLGAGDFEVLEDGEPVSITGVDFYPTRYGVAPTAEGVASEEAPASRYFVVFVHDQTRFGYFGGDLVRQQIRLGGDLESWVGGGLLPSDWLAVVSYDTRLHLHQDFTQDRAALVAAIADAVAGRRPQPGSRRGDGPLAILARMPDPGVRRTEVDDVYDALRIVAEATGVVVGRKNLLLFTAGIGRRIARGTRSVLDPHEAPALEASLNDANVAVYPIDITPPGKTHAYSAALSDLAERSGGVYHDRFSGFTSPLEAITAESAGYYLLSYQTSHPAGEVGYQRVEVRTDRPDLTVRARQGYLYGR